MNLIRGIISPMTDLGADPAIIQRVSGAGCRLTGPRRAILHAVASREGHFRAEEILEEARRLAPRTGRATVYRTLLLLAELGLVEQLHLGEGSHSFVIGDNGHHHHLICSRCGKVMEVYGCELPPAVNALAAREGFEIAGHQLEVYGRCRTCKESSPEALQGHAARLPEVLDG